MKQILISVLLFVVVFAQAQRNTLSGIITDAETGETQFLFNARLLKIGEKTLENSNGTNYKIVTLKFNLPSGEEVERTAMCYQANYDYGVETGKDYLYRC